MVDQLKKSLDNLEAPECGRCCKPMKWFSAQLLVQPAGIIEHTFFCPTCGGSAKVTTRFSPTSDDPKPPLKMRDNVLPFSPVRAQPPPVGRRTSAA